MTALILTLFMLIVQTTLLNMYGWTAPDLALIAAIYCGRKYGRLRGCRLGITIGIAQDLFSFGLLGVNLFSKGLIGLMSGSIRESNMFDPRSMTTWMVFLLTFTTLNELIGIMYFSKPSTSMAFTQIIYTIGLQSILNIIAGFILFYLMDRIVDRFKSAAMIRGTVLPR